MKKHVLLFFIGAIFLPVHAEVGYFETSNLLGEKGIIVKQNDISKYRLNDNILRQEVIGMALKLKGVTLPESYECKGYFSDVRNDDWVCRAIEIAADHGIITRKNTNARPKDFVTAEEATAIFLSARNIKYPKNIEVSPDVGFYSGKPQWIIDLYEGVLSLGIDIPFDSISGKLEAIRSDVFKVAYQVAIYEPGLKFINCGVIDNKPHIFLGDKDLLIPDIEEACLDQGYGRLKLRLQDNLYVSLYGDVASGLLVKINVKSPGITKLGFDSSLSQDAKYFVYFSDGKISILDQLGKVETYDIPPRFGFLSARVNVDNQFIEYSTQELLGPEGVQVKIDRMTGKVTTTSFSN